MQKKIIIVVIYFVFQITSGCSTKPLKPSTSHVDILINENLAFLLLPAFAAEKNFSLTQIVQIKYAKKHYDFITRLEIANHSFKLVGLTGMGVKLFTINSVDGDYKFETSPLLGSELNLAYLLADLQLTYWPVDQLNPPLQNHHAHIEAYTQQRLIFHHNEPIINIQFSSPDRWNKNIIFKHLKRNYTVTINTIEMEYL